MILVLSSMGVFISASAESPFHSVYGFVYINDVLAPADIVVKLTFIETPEEIIDETDTLGYYQVDFMEHNWEEGFFSVNYEDDWLIPTDNSSVEIIPEEIGYEIDLHVYILNSPPDRPKDPQPENNSVNISLNPTLSVFVSDPDEDIMDVSFFDASDDSLIETDQNVPSGGTANVEWSGLSYNTTYTWYATASDSEFESKSETWSFTTKVLENVTPHVQITKPVRGLYIFNKKILPRLIRPALIIGDITIEATVTNDDSDIEKVEFYICGELKGNDTSAPYTFEWEKDRIRLFHIFVIKVVAYNYDGASGFDRMIVRKFL